VNPVQPFERLRYIARHGADDRTLVAEAADCLADFDDDPAGLVVTCRRLLHHHPDCGPLWWLCARVLAAPEPSEAARAAKRLVLDDPTPTRLAGVLPFPHDEPIAVLGWPELVAGALATRPDLEVLAVQRPRGDERLHFQVARSDTDARVVDVAEAAALEPSHVLVEVQAMSPAQALVEPGTADALDVLARPATLMWLVAGAGRTLPSRLFDCVTRALDADAMDLLELQTADRIAGPTGLDRPERIQMRVDCPVAPELLRLA
jgi:hypothetical protein